MTYGERAGISPYESEQETKGIFVQNTDCLFELVDAIGQTDEQLFFSVEWGEEGEIKTVTPLHIAPTGARKQERNDGLFSQAQLKVQGEGDEPRFVWARITAQPTGTPIRLDHDTLDEDFGYKVLSDVKVSQVLGERTQSLSDYLYLTREMTRRNIELTSNFREPALKLMRELLDRSSALRIDRDSLEGLRYVLEGLSPGYAARIQHVLLSDILKTLLGRGDEAYRISFPDADEAASFLEAALHVGVIPQTEAFTRRVLAVDAVYKYPFATELLHSTLHKKSPRTYVKTVVGIEEEGLIRCYITAILQARAQDAQTDVESKIAGIFQGLSGISAEEGEQDYLVYLTDLRGMGTEFAAILRETQSSDPEIAAQQQKVDEQSIEIVTMLLGQLIKRKLAREALKRSKADDQSSTT